MKGTFWVDQYAARIVNQYPELTDDHWLMSDQVATWLWTTPGILHKWHRAAIGPAYIWFNFGLRTGGRRVRLYRVGTLRAWLQQRAEACIPWIDNGRKYHERPLPGPAIVLTGSDNLEEGWEPRRHAA